MKAVVIIEVKDAIDVEDFDKVLTQLQQFARDEANALSIKRASRADLEEFAEAGALLPNPAPLDWEDDEDEAAESIADD